MARYTFEAFTFAGKTEKGTIESDSVKQAKQQLVAKNLVPIKVELEFSQASSSSWQNLLNPQKSITPKELALITKQLALLVKSGIAIDEAVGLLADEIGLKKHIKTILENIVSELRSGLPFSKAISAHPKSFGPFYQGVVSAAEQSGKMGQVLTQLATFLEKRQALSQKALNAMIYPVMLACVSLAVILFLMTYVVPQIVKVFESTKQSLPFITQIVMGLSSFLTQWGLLLLVVILACVLLCKQLLRDPKRKLSFDRFCLRIPTIGSLLLAFDTAKFAGTMSMLIEANVPILIALNHAKNTLNNSVLRQAIEQTEIRLKEGSTLFKALGAQGVFSPILIYLIRSGEASGKLAEMFQYAGENAELEAEQKTTIFTNLLEPILILVMGLLVLGIVMAVMQPILEMNSGIR
jgi:general secretion pathway protein F